MRSCFFYLQQNDNPPNPEQVRKTLVEGTVEEKMKVLKQFIKCLVNDDTYPPMIMAIITNVIPLLAKHPEFRKVLLLYWEVIDKNKSPNDPTLKDQMFLACNSLRSDLLSFNQYLRGRTLRLVSRVMHRGVIEPLSSAIVENISHKSAYVRRNTVVCLYNIFCNFGSDVIGDIDEEIEELLKTETDLSTKRNSFILLNKSNPLKAMQYLQTQIKSQALEDIGDILQLAILKVLKQKAREEPDQKPRILKIINTFADKASQSVLLECSITSLSISNSVFSIKSSLTSYVNILSRTNELNVKNIILDKLETVCRNSNYIEQALVEDLVKNLETPSYAIKKKILDIVTMNLNDKIAHLVLTQLKKQLVDSNDNSYTERIVKTIEKIALKLPDIHSDILHFITEKLFKLPELSDQSAKSIKHTLSFIVSKCGPDQMAFACKEAIMVNFKTIISAPLIKQVLNLLGNEYNSPVEIELAINKLQVLIGPLPIVSAAPTSTESDENKHQMARKKAKSHFKTRILEDGSYQTVEVEDQGLEDEQQLLEEPEETLYFRNLLADDSIVGGIFTKNIGKLLYKMRRQKQFNKFACSSLMILCSLFRNYEQRIYQVDQTTIDLISSLIRKVIHPDKFINQVDPVYEQALSQQYIQSFTQLQIQELEEEVEDRGQTRILEKNPEDLIFFRQLKKGLEQSEEQFDDEEVNEVLNEKAEQRNFIDKLKSMCQLSGINDPIYAESFITVNKYDILFEILIMNVTNTNMLNVQVEFSSKAEILVLEKAQSINLRPKESAHLVTQIRFVSGQFGSVFGYINFDNQAGLEQPYLITEEIKINYMQFIVPAKISELGFKKNWAALDKKEQLTHSVTLSEDQKLSHNKIAQIIQRELHCLEVNDHGSSKDSNTEYFINKNFYGQSKLGKSFYLTVTLFIDQSIDIHYTLKSKQPAILEMLHKRIKDIVYAPDEEVQND